VRDDGDVRVTATAQPRNRGIEPRGRERKQCRVVGARRVRREHGHLHRQRRVAVIGQRAAQLADQRPIRIHAGAVHDDHRAFRLCVGFRVEREHARRRRRCQPHGASDDELRDDLVGPARFAGCVGGEGRG
jgi:hypothetical protein